MVNAPQPVTTCCLPCDYSNTTFDSDVIQCAKVNSLAIKATYADSPAVRDQELQGALLNAQQTLEKNSFYRMHSPDKKAETQAMMSRLFESLPGKDPLFTNDCYKTGYSQYLGDDALIPDLVRNVSLLKRCLATESDQWTGLAFEKVRFADRILSSKGETLLEISELSEQAMDFQLADTDKCYLTNSARYYNAIFPTDILETEVKNRSLIKTCYAHSPEKKDDLFKREEQWSRLAMTSNFFYQNDDPKTQEMFDGALHLAITKGRLPKRLTPTDHGRNSYSPLTGLKVEASFICGSMFLVPAIFSIGAARNTTFARQTWDLCTLWW